ncbi:MAG: TrmH family RNA methyltransferase [Eubacteriaceae bacterium]|jgi:TrmH family RNA methyltransferase
MSAEVIRSRSNREVRENAKLVQKKYRDRSGLFLADGTKLFQEALDSGMQFERVYYTDEWFRSAAAALQDLILRLEEERTAVPVTPEVLKLVSSVKSPEGIVSVIRKPEEIDPESLLTKDSQLTTGHSYVILEDVQDPGNLGTIIRTADAAGYDAVILTEGCADIYSEKTLRASMGSVFHLPVVRTGGISRFLNDLREHGFEAAGASLQGETIELCQTDRPQRLALILGNESRGLSEKTAGLCTRLVKIPIYGRAESLNVAVAAGILLYAFAQK